MLWNTKLQNTERLKSVGGENSLKADKWQLYNWLTIRCACICAKLINQEVFGDKKLTTYLLLWRIQIWSRQSTSHSTAMQKWKTQGLVSVIDKSLDLEKISRRNDSYFSISSWRIVFSFLFLFSIFKMLRQKFSFSSWLVRFSKQFSFSSRFSRLWRKNLSTLDLRDSVHCFSFSSCEKCFIF